MKKNYLINFKVDLEFNNLLNDVLKKINQETKMEFKKSDLIRTVLKTSLIEIKTGNIQSKEIFFNTK